MFGLQVPAWEIAIRTAVIYLVILVGLRLAGKREVGQVNGACLGAAAAHLPTQCRMPCWDRTFVARRDHRSCRTVDDERYSG